MTTPSDIDSKALHEALESRRIVDVRTPAEFETEHIPGSVNVPLDILRSHRDEVVARLDGDIVLVCRSGQRAGQAGEALRNGGFHGARVLRGGLVDWHRHGLAVDRGEARWDLERQVRLVAGFIVLSSILGSTLAPRLKWIAAGIGGGLTFAAVSNTCAMASALSKLPYNRGPRVNPADIVARLEANGD